jgi:hypothetical protein
MAKEVRLQAATYLNVHKHEIFSIFVLALMETLQAPGTLFKNILVFYFDVGLVYHLREFRLD